MNANNHGWAECLLEAGAHSSAETMPFCIAAGSFDRLQRAEEKESLALSDSCLNFVPRNMWSVSRMNTYTSFRHQLDMFCFCGCFVIFCLSPGISQTLDVIEKTSVPFHN